ncbi:MAG: hypothetical protein AAF806_22215, partial [Bacteroidota bacterium]
MRTHFILFIALLLTTLCAQAQSNTQLKRNTLEFREGSNLNADILYFGNDLFIRNLNSQATTADIRLDARTDIFLDANDDILFRTGSPANTQM